MAGDTAINGPLVKLPPELCPNVEHLVWTNELRQVLMAHARGLPGV